MPNAIRPAFNTLTASLWRTSYSAVVLTVVTLALGVPTARASNDLTIVFFGGFGSCALGGSTSELRAGPALDTIAEQVDRSPTFHFDSVRWIRSCFALGSSTLYTSTSDGDAFQASANEGLQLIASHLRRGNGSIIILLGQSHGGTMAALLAAQLHDTDLRLVFTMDAISINTCGPVTFSGSLLDSIFGSSYDNGCTGLPEELETFGPAVAHNSGLWINGYQTDYAPLHSAPSSYADDNIHWQDLDGGLHPMGQHAATETDTYVWSTVEHYIKSVLAP